MEMMQCRVCLNFSNCCTSLFCKNNGTSVSQMIRFCTGVQINEEDDLPSHACTMCCEEATLAYMFVNKCRKSDAELRTQQIIGKHSRETEVDNIDTHSVESGEILSYNNQQYQEPCSFEILEETAADVSLQSWQDNALDEDYMVDELDDETNGAGNEDVEYLYEYTKEDTMQSSNEAAEGHNGEHESPARCDLSDQCTKTNAVYFCCYGECTLLLNTKRKLKEHLHFEHQVVVESEGSNDTANRCSNCERFFQTEDELKIHEKQLLLKRSVLPRRRSGRHRVYPSIFEASEKKCCGCFEVFDTMEALHKHSEANHAIRKTATDPNRPVQCQICYKLFRSEAHVRTHLTAVYKPRSYCCVICGASFARAAKLANHQNMHGSEQKYVCTECGACLKTEQNLKMHALLHREKREVCKTCGLRFHRKSNLKMHQRIHDDTYYYVCSHCPKKFKTRSHLKEHLKVHTKEKPFNCRHCSKQFRYLSDRKRHEMEHTGDYPFECGTCLKKFARSISYNRHLRKCSSAAVKEND